MICTSVFCLYSRGLHGYRDDRDYTDSAEILQGWKQMLQKSLRDGNVCNGTSAGT